MIKVIGVHTNTTGGSSVKGSSIGDGHSWLSLHYESGRYDTIGLWVTDGKMTQIKRFIPLNDFAAAMVGEEVTYEVVLGEERRKNYQALFSRFYGMNDARRQTAMGLLIQRSAWRYEYTCATWVTEKMKQIFGQSFATSELFGLTNTPRALGNVLHALEVRNPTSLKQPTFPA